MELNWSWQPGADDDMHGFTVAAGRPVWLHVWRSLDTGAFEWDGEILGMGGEMVSHYHRIGLARGEAQNDAEDAVVVWASRELARHTRRSLEDEQFRVEHPEWDVAS
jgi:hypothetical protein